MSYIQAIIQKNPLLYSLFFSNYLSYLDIAFALKYCSPENDYPSFLFLSLSSALWKQGVPFLKCNNLKLFPTPPNIDQATFYNLFSEITPAIKDALFIEENNCIYLKELFYLRERVFNKLDKLSLLPPHIWIPEEHLHKNMLSDEQFDTLKNSLQSSLSIICGGPGTGKTFLAVQLIKNVISYYDETNIAILSPTGKASSHIKNQLSKNNILSQKIHSQTIHSFIHNTRNSHHYDIIIVDESSMLTLSLLDHLLNSLQSLDKKITSLILIGDVNQLPPIGIGVGSPLSDIIKTYPQHTSYLNVIKRTNSPIIHKLSQDVLKKNPITALKLPLRHELINLIADNYNRIFKENEKSANQFCVLTPMRQGAWGFSSLNHDIFNVIQKEYDKPSFIPIMITEKYSKLNLSNGDTGILNTQTNEIIFQHREPLIIPSYYLKYNYNYVLSIHKSQGSEYQKVWLIIPPGSESFHASILYTGVTRAKEEVSILAEPSTLKKIREKKDFF